MFTKTAIFKLIDAQPLNRPIAKYGFVIEQEIFPSADLVEATIDDIRATNVEAELQADGDATRFDLEAEIKAHPDSLFVKCFAIKADEMNDNGDFFSQEELKLATSSFVGVPVFTNHNNADAEAARGKVVHSWWNDSRNGIMIIARVDAEAYPQLARGIKEEYIVGTSMGCQVKYSLCSICHNKAETPDQYCEHIKERKTRQIHSKRQKCHYHKHGNGGECPICGSKKGDTKTYEIDKKAFEFNYGVKFIENSFVVNPACMDCGVIEVIDPHAFAAKVAEIREKLPRLLKVAAEQNVMCSDQGCLKLAGQAEIDSLNEALDLLTSVSQAMLSQKAQIDLEFLSDLVKVLADLQTTTDELTEQGYGRIPSPGEGEDTGENIEQPGGPPAGDVTGTVQPMQPTPGGGSKIQSGPAGGVGTVTSPSASKRVVFKKVSKRLMGDKKLRLGFGLPHQRLAIPMTIKPGKSVTMPFSIKRAELNLGYGSNFRFSTEEAKILGEEIGIDWNSSPFRVAEFKDGLHVELEHGFHDPDTNVTDNDPIATAKITWIHLKELPDYYTRLKKMEGEAGE